MVDQPSVLLWKDLHDIADKVCVHFGLAYGKLLPETRTRARCYGETSACDRCQNSPYVDPRNCNEKLLRVRVHVLNKKKPLANSTIIRTLAHEMAHLREWDHSPAHKEFELEILEFIRDLGYDV